MQTVDVLGRVDGQQGPLLVEPGGSGSCTRYALTLGSALKRATTASSTSAWVAAAGRCSPTECMPMLAQSSCFIAT